MDFSDDKFIPLPDKKCCIVVTIDWVRCGYAAGSFLHATDVALVNFDQVRVSNLHARLANPLNNLLIKVSF